MDDTVYRKFFWKVLTEARNAESISNFRKKLRKFVYQENSSKLPSIWRIISYELCHKNVKILIRNFEIFCQKFVKVQMFTANQRKFDELFEKNVKLSKECRSNEKSW